MVSVVLLVYISLKLAQTKVCSEKRAEMQSPHFGYCYGHDLCASEQTFLVVRSLGWLQLVSFR